MTSSGEGKGGMRGAFGNGTLRISHAIFSWARVSRAEAATAAGRRRSELLRPHQSELGAGRLGASAAWDAAGEEGVAAGFDGVAHGGGHADRIVGPGDSGVEKDGGSAEFHGNDGVRRSADAGIDDDRNRPAAADQF